MESKESVVLVEVGFREGLQRATRRVSAQELLPVVQEVMEAGFKVIELGTIAKQYKGTCEDIAPALFRAATQLSRKPGVVFQAVGKGTAEETRMAVDLGCNCLKLVSGGSDTFINALLEGRPGDFRTVMREFPACVQIARQNGMDINGAISFAFASAWEGEIPCRRIEEIVECYIDAGVTEISLSDTHGMSNPKLTLERASRLMAKYPEVRWFGHIHDTKGLGLVNTWACYQAGVRKFDASFAGVGGCPYFTGSTGNVASEDLVDFFEVMGISTGVDLDKALELAAHVEAMDFNFVESKSLRLAKIRSKIGR